MVVVAVAEFQDGEIVDIAIKGARVVNSYPTSHNREDTGLVLVVRLADDTGALVDGRSLAVNLKSPGVSVVRVGPPEWPPQPGDLWRDRSRGLWVAIDMRDTDETDVPDVQLVYAYEGRLVDTPEHAAEMYGPFGLVHREEQAGGGRL
jgi:hypothetical protein